MVRCVAATVALASLLGACGVEKRHVGPQPPASPPAGQADARQGFYETNRFERAEGARLFRWAGCDACHGENARGPANLTDRQWRYGGSVSDIYGSVADGRPGMPAYRTRLTAQQLWQISGYLKSVSTVKPNMRRRSAADQLGEPSGALWQGALR